MKGFRGPSVKVEPGFYQPVMPIPAPLKMEAAFVPGHPYFHPSQSFQFPFHMMPRPFLQVGLPPMSPHLPFPPQPSCAPLPPRSPECKPRAVTKLQCKTEEEPPVLDLSVRKHSRSDSPVLNTVSNSELEPEDFTCDPNCEQEQGLDLSCPDKQNGGKTFKKALLNRYNSKLAKQGLILCCCLLAIQ